MCTQVSAVALSSEKTVPMSTQNDTPGVARRLAKFTPSIWGDRFLSSPEATEIDSIMEKRAEELKEEVKRKMNIAAAGNMLPAEILNLIDLIQRLGVSYHFEDEIDEALRQVVKINSEGDKEDLYMVSLQFRLLRQQGYNVPCDVFINFTDENGQLKEDLTTDVRAILSLYEASHLRFHGEDILDQALAFTATYLESIVSDHDLSPPLQEQVSLALKHPIRKSLPRSHAWQFFSIYQEDALHDQVLLDFAKLDYNILQKLHQKELSVISRWWKDLDLARKSPFARDRVVECFVWTVGVYFEPQFSFARKILAKVMTLTTIIDDIYDAYGTLDELIVFTDAFERWDIGCMDILPDYIKPCYQALLDTYEEIERDLTKQGNNYGAHYSKEEMKKLVQAYIKETKWLEKNYIPTMDEYMSNSLTSTGYHMLVTTSFLGMGDIATKDVLDWVTKQPKIVKAVSTICRLMDDIAGHQACLTN